MGTITQLPNLTCQATSPTGRPCIERHGHGALGLTHLDAHGDEWIDTGLDGIDGTYASTGYGQMAQAS